MVRPSLVHARFHVTIRLFHAMSRPSLPNDAGKPIWMGGRTETMRGPWLNWTRSVVLTHSLHRKRVPSHHQSACRIAELGVSPGVGGRGVGGRFLIGIMADLPVLKAKNSIFSVFGGSSSPRCVRDRHFVSLDMSLWCCKEELKDLTLPQKSLRGPQVSPRPKAVVVPSTM